MIKQIIADNNITTHKELDKHLAKLSGDRYYYSYDLEAKKDLASAGLLSKCVIIELEGISRYYENEKI